jgi:lipopolysaccharide assembly outer membrane protein LptD (OstA)
MKRPFDRKFESFLSAMTFLSLTLFAAQSHADLSLSLDSKVHLQADTIEFLRDQNLVMAKGQVHIQQGLVHLYADQIRYDVTAQDIQATGHVIWQNENEEIEAQTLNYNLRSKIGHAFNIKTTSPPWVSTGSEIDILEQKVVIKDAVTSTCDFPAGYRHFYLKADKITIYSGDYLVAENVVLYIGKVPVFYFPFFVKTIHDIRTPLSISTGQTDYLGNYVLLTTNYLFNPTSYGSLSTDYFFKKGLGLGLRHEIALNDYSVLSLYGYGIDEKDTNHLRWESRIRGLWALSSSVQGRIEADIPGDGMFSQDYSVARRDPSLVSTQREYDLSATLSRQQYSLGVLFRRQETPNFNDTTDTIESHFNRSLQTLPQLNFSLFPQRLIGSNWLKWDLSLNGDHTWTQADGYYVNHLTGELGISQSVLLFQTQTIFSRFAMDENYQNLADIGGTNFGETHTVNTNNTWTGRWTDFFTSTFSHTFNQKLDNLLPTDPPHGITSNLLTGSMEFTGGSVFRTTTSTSYDFGAQVSTESARLSYLRQEIYLTPSPYYDYLGILDYSVDANTVKDFNTVLNIRSPRDMWRFRMSGNFVDPNVSNTGYIGPGGVPSTFEIAGEVDFAFFTNYRISMIESYDVTNAQFETRSISIYRDLHDWEAQLSYTQDPIQGSKAFFTLNLKAFPGRPLTVSNDQLNQINGIRNQGLTGSATQFQ